MRRASVLVAAAVWVLGAAEPARADNCSGLADCYGSASSAVAAVTGISVLVAAAVLFSPSLLRGAASAPPPPVVAADSEERERSRGRDGARQAGEDADEGAQGDGADAPSVQERPTRLNEKIRQDMRSRGWTEQSVELTLRQPTAVLACRDLRHNLDGGRADQPATAFIRPDGWYVVANDRTGDLVQVSGGALDGWAPAPPSGPRWPTSLAADVAADAGVTPVEHAGPEPCYPIAEAHRVVDLCAAERIVILGMDAFAGAPGRLSPRLDLIFDCSPERVPAAGPGGPHDRHDRARALLREWAGQSATFVAFTLRTP